MQQMRFLRLFCCLALTVVACKSSRTVDQGTEGEDSLVTWEVVSEGAYSNQEEASNQLIQNADDWQSLWSIINKGRFPTPALPEVDFETQNLLACFMGMKTSGGHSIQVETMTMQGESLMVKVVQESPGQNCMVTDAITYPYVIVAVDKPTSTNPQFEVETRTDNCDQ